MATMTISGEDLARAAGRLFDVGGEPPSGKTVSFSGSTETTKKLRKGDQYEFRITGTVVEVGFVDKYDKEGFVVEVVRKQKIQVDDVQVVDPTTGELSA